MQRVSFFLAASVVALTAGCNQQTAEAPAPGLQSPAITQPAELPAFRPVTQAMLENPDPSDWLMINRTYDEQRFSPLDQINKGNVGNMRLVWARGLPQGSQETTPIVSNGVLYAVVPGGGVIAINGTTGDQLWEYFRDMPRDAVDIIGGPETARTKSIAIYQDMIFYAAPDGYIVALGAEDGKERWATQAHDYNDATEHTGGMIVADGKIITNRTCEARAGCYISAHDAMTGQEVWKFWNTPGAGEAGEESWGGLPVDKRIASSWGLPGSYDPVRKRLYWAISNPKPYTRLKRHGSIDAVPFQTPADLYSNSTVSINVETGALDWYYQHLPGDDWDADHLHERTLVRTAINPDPAAVKWINPNVTRGEERDIVFAVGEAGGMFALDRQTGQFLWASPFPVDTPQFHISDIEPTTGKVTINRANMFEKEGDRHINCFHNTRSYWSTAYNPRNNSLYIPYHDTCLDMTAMNANPMGFGPRFGVLRPGGDPAKFLQIAKVDLATGKITNIHAQSAAGNGSALVTGGDLLFWGDMNRRFRAFDADTGQVLWETILGGIIQTSTITYAVNGKQYVAVMTGDGQSGTANPVMLSNVSTVRGHNAIYVFALP
jgi:alcohol dehydrogenase (cytochrome c)